MWTILPAPHSQAAPSQFPYLRPLTSDPSSQAPHLRPPGPKGGGVLRYMSYIGMCGPKGYGFSAVLVINWISILADFGHFGHK